LNHHTIQCCKESFEVIRQRNGAMVLWCCGVKWLGSTCQAPGDGKGETPGQVEYSLRSLHNQAGSECAWIGHRWLRPKRNRVENQFFNSS
jgi:hypothetical protein